MNKIDKNYTSYLINIEYMEYLTKVARLKLLFFEFSTFKNRDCLDIDYDYYDEQLSIIEKKVKLVEKEVNNNLEVKKELYKSYTDEVNNLLENVSKEFEPLIIVDLYIKSINSLIKDSDSKLEEIILQIQKLMCFVDDLKLFDRKEYEKVYEKYGLLEAQTLIKYIVIAMNSDYKSYRKS